MTTLTTDEQISAMKDMAAGLERDLADQIEEAHIDDWGRFGNFTLMVTPRHHDRHTTTRLKAVVRRALPKGARLREVFPPEPVRDYNCYTRTSRVRGYNRTFWIFDIDYMHYDRESNTFHAVD